MVKSNSVKRLLCIVGGLNTGGAETFLMKIYRELDRSKYQMDFYVMSQEIGYYEDEIKLMGGKIYHSIPKSRNFVKAFNLLRKTVKENQYKYVMRVSQHSLATLDLLAAKLGGAENLIQRSSNANSGSSIARVLHFIFRWLTKLIPDIKIAPSTEAAEYTFGEKSVKRGEVMILKNALKVEHFIFDLHKRDKIRKEFQISNSFVVGHIGRFNHQKNHSFLIDIFYEIAKKNDNAVLLLVGEGELENTIKEKVKKLNITEKVIFAGIRSDIPDIMMAMDVLIFPSYFEGMPNVIIEAQATGLPCIISDKITREVKLLDYVYFLSLNKKPKEWAEKSLTSCNTSRGQKSQIEYIKLKYDDNGYSIKSVTDFFIKSIFF